MFKNWLFFIFLLIISIFPITDKTTTSPWCRRPVLTTECFSGVKSLVVTKRHQSRKIAEWLSKRGREQQTKEVDLAEDAVLEILDDCRRRKLQAGNQRRCSNTNSKLAEIVWSFYEIYLLKVTLVVASSLGWRWSLFLLDLWLCLR